MRTQNPFPSLISRICQKIYIPLFIVLILAGFNYNALSKELPPEQAKILEVLSVYINTLKTKQASADEIFDKIDFNVGTITEISHIKDRKAALNEFIDANAVLMDTRKNAEAILTEELEKRDVSQKSIDAYLKGYRDGQTKQHALLLKIDVTNTQSMETWLSIMDLLEAKWGVWEPYPENLSIQTEDEELIEKFNKFLERTDSIANEQAKYIEELQSQ
ncbi:MAG: hypothetical protein HOF76_03015 [Candidatus Scalindua sp.]|jgi:hypothetical protein|nr:hypothetical protein [Candidatus Scalindua sp.]